MWLPSVACIIVLLDSSALEYLPLILTMPPSTFLVIESTGEFYRLVYRRVPVCRSQLKGIILLFTCELWPRDWRAFKEHAQAQLLGLTNTSVYSDQQCYGLTLPTNDTLLVSSQYTVIFFYEKKEAYNLVPSLH